MPGLGRRVAVALVVAAILAPGAAHAGVPRVFHGVTVQEHLSEADVERLSHADVGSVRFMISWQTTEPRPGVFDWREIDSYLTEISRTGAEAIPFIEAAPSWLPTDESHDPMSTPESQDAWRRFASALADRYGSGGAFAASHPETEVGLWQLWNEPNLASSWGASPSAPRYAQLVAIGSEALRSQDPSARVMLAGLAPARRGIEPRTFLHDLLRNADPDSFDIAAIHPYASGPGGVVKQVSLVREEMRKAGVGSAPLAVTEIGWASSQKGGAAILAGTPRSQATRLTQVYAAFARHPQWRITRALWFSLRDAEAERLGCGFCATSGLLSAEGAPKPAWLAFKRSMHSLRR